MACLLVKTYRTEITDHSLDSVSLERAKEHLLIYEDDFDSIISRYIRTATSTLEEWMGYYTMPANVKSYYGYCSQCSYIYILPLRPFNSVVSVEILQDGSYVTLTPEQYTLEKGDWEAYIKFCDGITPDDECEDVDPVVITYSVGDYRELTITDITAVGNTATVTVSEAHGLINGDQVIISGSGELDLDGTYSITVLSATTFSYSYVGAPDLTSATGTVTVPEMPAQIEQSILMMVAGMYTNRGDCSDSCGPVPCAVQGLAGQFKRQIARIPGGSNGCHCG